MNLVASLTAIDWTVFIVVALVTLLSVRILKLIMNGVSFVAVGKPVMRFFEEGQPWWKITHREIHAFWYGMLSVIGNFDRSKLNEEENATLKEKMHYFWAGQTFLILGPALLVGYVQYLEGGWDQGYSTFLAISGALFNRPKKIAENVFVKLWNY